MEMCLKLKLLTPIRRSNMLYVNSAKMEHSTAWMTHSLAAHCLMRTRLTTKASMYMVMVNASLVIEGNIRMKRLIHWSIAKAARRGSIHPII